MEPEEVRQARVHLQRLMQAAMQIDGRFQSPASAQFVSSVRQCMLDLATAAAAGEVDLEAAMQPARAVKVIPVLPAASKEPTR